MKARAVLAVLLLLALSLPMSDCALAQGGFGGGAFRAVVRAPMAREQAEVYVPVLERALTAELHFVKKVCDPSEHQFRKLHRAGKQAVFDISTLYAELQRQRKTPDAWPDPNDAIALALQETVDEILPASVAQRYRVEIQARFDARVAADAAVVVNLIDQHVVLDPTQQDELIAAIAQNWQSDWSRANVVTMYPQYASLPDKDLLRPYLSELQQRLWSYRPTPRHVRLSWQVHFAGNGILSAQGLEDFDDPDTPGAVEESK